MASGVVVDSDNRAVQAEGVGSLDPEDWEEFRGLLHRAVDDSVDWLRTVRDRPVWQPMPDGIRKRLDVASPWEGADLEDVYEEYRELVLPYVLGNVHPRFWGWVCGEGTPGGVLAELVRATSNTNSAAFAESNRVLEQRVVAWMLDVFGMPASGSGILLGGGSVANFVGLAVARDTMAGFDVAAGGLEQAARRLVLYASTEVHNSVDKAAQLLGLGRESLRKIPVSCDHRLRLDRLRQAIQRDRNSGLTPIAVVASAGTVNTGAIDDLDAVADLCAAERLWLHVDGAFGALGALSPTIRPRLDGIQRADSLAFDFHKWLHVQYGVGCTLFRDAAVHRRPFTVAASYLSPVERGPAAQPHPSHEYGPELSRAGSAIKVWMALREHGLAKLGQLVARNVAQAAYLSELVEHDPELELLCPVSLNIVCYRYVPRDRTSWSEGDLERLNTEVLLRLQERGIAVPSHTRLGERFAIRVCITSHRSRAADFQELLRESVLLGREVASEIGPASRSSSITGGGECGRHR